MPLAQHRHSRKRKTNRVTLFPRLYHPGPTIPLHQQPDQHCRILSEFPAQRRFLCSNSANRCVTSVCQHRNSHVHFQQKAHVQPAFHPRKQQHFCAQVLAEMRSQRINPHSFARRRRTQQIIQHDQGRRQLLQQMPN